MTESPIASAPDGPGLLGLKAAAGWCRRADAPAVVAVLAVVLAGAAVLLGFGSRFPGFAVLFSLSICLPFAGRAAARARSPLPLRTSERAALLALASFFCAGISSLLLLMVVTSAHRSTPRANDLGYVAAVFLSAVIWTDRPGGAVDPATRPFPRRALSLTILALAFPVMVLLPAARVPPWGAGDPLAAALAAPIASALLWGFVREIVDDLRGRASPRREFLLSAGSLVLLVFFLALALATNGSDVV